MLSRFTKKAAITVPAETESAAIVPFVVADDNILGLKVRLHQRLIDELNLPIIEKMPREQFESEIGDIIRDMLSKETSVINERERKQFVADILDELLGLGPLEPLLKDTSIADIIVNTYKQVCIERRGKIEITPVRF